MDNTAKGYLKVRVTRAGGTLPVEGAAVRISEYKNSPSEEDRLLYSLRTDRGGLTETVSLDAPAFNTSTRPGYSQPFALYNIRVTQGGYYTVELVGVPVFGRVVAVQPVDLMPLDEADRIAGAEGDRVIIYEMSQSEALAPSGGTAEDIFSKSGQINSAKADPEETVGGEDE